MMMHPLLDYLKSRGLQQLDLERLSGVPQYTISRVINGEKPRAFKPDDAVRIFRATHGAVTIEQLRMPGGRIPTTRRARKGNKGVTK